MDKPLVSIIVSLFNMQEYVGQCINSLKMQTYTNWEAICIDDASTDATLERACAAAENDQRFHFVQRNKNGGLSVVRNQGIDLARGDYVLFLDSDDYYVPEALERLTWAARTHHADLVDFNAHIFYETDDVVEKMSEEYYSTRPDIAGAMAGPDLFCCFKQSGRYCYEACFHFIARSLLQRTGLKFLPGIIHEDTLFTPLLHAYAQCALYLNEPLYQRRVHNDSIFTSKRGVRNIAGFYQTTKHLQTWLEEHAGEYSDTFIYEFSQTIWDLRTTMANDIRTCAKDELAEYMGGLSSADRADFMLYGLHYAQCLDEKFAWGDELQEVYASKTWRLGNALAALPRKAAQLARKDNHTTAE